MQPAAVCMAIYLRVSTEEQARGGYSLGEQREACRRLARDLVPDVTPDQIAEFVDTFGGDVLERPVLEELRAFVQRRRPAWFICLDPDRFSRHLGAQLLLTEEIERAGTRLAFVQHAYAKSAEGQLFYQLRGAVAQFEKAKILERTQRGKQGKIRAGGRPNGAAPFGYRHNKETDALEVHEPEAAWVRQLFGWARDGLSPYQIARRLEEYAVPTRLGGRRWRRSTVAAMLRNTTYMGQMRCNRYDTRGLGAVRRLPRDKRRPITAATRPEAEWQIVPAPPLVDADLFGLVQRRLATTGRKGNRPTGRLLSMLVRCGACGGRMAYSLVAGRRLYLKCNRRYADLAGYNDQTRCRSSHHRAEPVEQGVWATLAEWLLDPALHEAWLAEGAVETDGPARAHLEERRRALERQQALVMAKLAQGLLSETVADTLLADVCDQIRQVDTALASAGAGDLPRAPDAAAALEQTRCGLARLDPAQRRALVRQLVQAVVVHPDGTFAVLPL